MSVRECEKLKPWRSIESFDTKPTIPGVASDPYNLRKGQERKKGNENEKDQEEGGTEKTCKLKQHPSWPSLPKCPRYTKRKKGIEKEKDQVEGGTEKTCKIKQHPSCSLPEFPRYTKDQLKKIYGTREERKIDKKYDLEDSESSEED
ncbi:uncharacterized protein [Pocillopora verrucosa]|uniref:uncharacterized protein isoform X2 n=1 Tax=Pocillopora verrucosa TaxID=203993 RepID=UPI00333ED12E